MEDASNDVRDMYFILKGTEPSSLKKLIRTSRSRYHDKFKDLVEKIEQLDLKDGALHSHLAPSLQPFHQSTRTPSEQLRWKVWTRLWLGHCFDPSLLKITSTGTMTHPTNFKRNVLRVRSTVDGETTILPVFMPAYDSPRMQNCVGDKGRHVACALHLWSDAHPVQITAAAFEPKLSGINVSHGTTAGTVLFETDVDPYDLELKQRSIEHVAPQALASLFLPNDPNNMMLCDQHHNNLRSNHPYTFFFSPAGEYYVTRRVSRRPAWDATKLPSNDPRWTTQARYLVFVAQIKPDLAPTSTVRATDFVSHVFVPIKEQRAQLARKWLYARAMYTPLFNNLKQMSQRQREEFDGIVALAFDPAHAPQQHERRCDYAVALQFDGWHNPLINDTLLRTIRSSFMSEPDNRVPLTSPEQEPLTSRSTNALVDARHIRDNATVCQQRRSASLVHVTKFLKVLTHTPAEMGLNETEYTPILDNMLRRTTNPFELPYS